MGIIRSYTNEDILNRDSYTLGMAGQADMDQSGDIAPPRSDLQYGGVPWSTGGEVTQELSAGPAAYSADQLTAACRVVQTIRIQNAGA